MQGRLAAATAAVAATAALAMPAAAAAKGCDWDVAGVFGGSVTKTTCAKGEAVAQAWTKKSSCRASAADRNARCKVKKYSCTSKWVADPDGPDYQRVTCKLRDMRVKFSHTAG